MSKPNLRTAAHLDPIKPSMTLAVTAKDTDWPA